MIRFSGTIRREYQDKIVKLRSVQLGIALLLIGLVPFIVGVVISMHTGSMSDLRSFIVMFALLVVVAIVLIVSPGRRNRPEWDYDITVSEDTVRFISLHQDGGTVIKPVKKVKKVVDCGGYYYLYLHRLDASHGIICQKDLLIEGSLEEFENIFAGKIKRKIK